MDARLPEYQAQTKRRRSTNFFRLKKGIPFTSPTATSKKNKWMLHEFQGMWKNPGGFVKKFVSTWHQFLSPESEAIIWEAQRWDFIFGNQQLPWLQKKLLDGWRLVVFLSFVDGLSLLTGWWYSCGGKFEWQLFVHNTSLWMWMIADRYSETPVAGLDFLVLLQAHTHGKVGKSNMIQIGSMGLVYVPTLIPSKTNHSCRYTDIPCSHRSDMGRVPGKLRNCMARNVGQTNPPQQKDGFEWFNSQALLRETNDVTICP